MGKTSLCLVALLALLLPASLLAGGPAGNDPANAEPPTTREIFVPFADLNVLLEKGPHRVLLSRAEYDALVKKAKLTPERHPPQNAAVLSAEYDIATDEQRARITGTLLVDVLDRGLQALPLDLGGVGLLAARLDDQDAPIGRAPDGRLNLLVEGVGRHTLTLEMITPLETTAAQQIINFRLPRAAVGRMRLVVPGDVELRSGAEVSARRVDKAAGVTRFELLPRAGDTTILMTLNSHLQRREQAVAARSVLVDEVTESCEKLHATITLVVLHRAVDRLRLVVPEGFEITEINSPLLARWDIETEGGRKIANVRLREQTTDTVVLGLAAIRAPAEWKNWHLPRLDLLDVVGQVSVVGLLADEQLKAELLLPEDLIPIDVAVLERALPATLLRPEPGAVPLRPVAAYYAPQAGYALSATFSRPEAELAVTTNVLLVLQEKGCEVRGGFALLPDRQKRFSIDFSVPAGWQVTGVTGPGDKPLAMDYYGPPAGPGRVHVRLGQAVAPGQQYSVNFHALATPPGWLDDWKTRQVELPLFAVLGATRDEGAVAVVAQDDLVARPEGLARLVPLTEPEKARYGLAGIATTLAYRYERPEYKATLAVSRTQPRLVARTFSFFQVQPEGLTAHYELIYRVDEAKTRRLALRLPASTPEALAIRGLGDVQVKEFSSQPAGAWRRWNVLLGDARRDEIRLAVDFQQPLPAAKPPSEGTAGSSARVSRPRRDPTEGLQGIGRPSVDGVARSETGHNEEADPQTGHQPPATSHQPPATPEPGREITLPVVEAEGVAYQSGLVAVEGSAELDVEVRTTARHVDIGQLAPAEYQPGRRLLGAYEFLGSPAAVAVEVLRHGGYALLPAIIEQAELTTLLSADGVSQTQADFRLRTKAQYLEVQLPAEAELWSAGLDGTPLKPQRQSGSRLLGLPAGTEGVSRSLELVYSAPVVRLGLTGRVRLGAPKLLFRAGREDQAVEVPLVSIRWHLSAPAGYEVVRTGGTLATDQVQSPIPAPFTVAGVIYLLTGGMPGPYSPGGCGGPLAMESPKSARPKGGWGPMPVPAAKAPVPGVDMSEAKVEAKPAEKAAEKEMIQEATAAMHDRRAADELGLQRGDKDDKVAMGRETQALAPADHRHAMVGALDDVREEREAAERRSGATLTTEPPIPFPDKEVWRDLARRRSERYATRLSGVRSLKIDVQQTPQDLAQDVTFQSLGVEPELVVTLARQTPLAALGWTLALAIALRGMMLTGRGAGRKAAFVLGVGLAAVALRLVWDDVALAQLCDMAFFAAALLVPYFLLAGAVRWLCRSVGRLAVPPAACGSVLLIACGFATIAGAQPPIPEGPYRITPADGPPVDVPAEAILLPYDPQSQTGIQNADRLLVPYDRYVELWNRANPNKKIETQKPPLPYALGGTVYQAVLEGDEALVLTGHTEIDVTGSDYASVPLWLRGGVLARADLDGKPARLSVTVPAPQEAKAAQAPAADGALLTLQVSGKGRHRLELEVRLHLTRQGGWRLAQGMLPTAAASRLTIRVPKAQTEVRLGQAADRGSRETTRADEQIQTALGPAGELNLQWRPKLSEGQVDRGLTAQSAALLDVEEDGLHLAWRMTLEFRHSQRDRFTVLLPKQYKLEKVAGGNVRGWEVREAGGEQSVEITLLKTAKDSEQFTLFLWRGGKVGQGDLAEFDFPLVVARDAALSSGQATIRRSPLLELRTLTRVDAARIDLGGELPDLSAAPGTEESVLRIRPYEAYHFPAMPFTLQLRAAATLARATADVETLVKAAEYEPSLQTRVVFHVEDRPVYVLRLALPDDLGRVQVTAPCPCQWSINQVQKRRVLSVYLVQGQQGDVALDVSGTLAAPAGPDREMPLPHVEVLDVARQQGDVAVQADPAFDVRAHGLAECQESALGRLAIWLDPKQREAARLALRYARPDYQGTLRLVPRVPDVSCDTISNVRVTDRAVEETIFLNFSIQRAGIHELSVLLPDWMKDARISVPMLRQKSVEAVPAGAKPTSGTGMVRVKIELQDDVMNDFRILVENDRMLTPGGHTAPIPVVETGRTNRQYVTLETAGRDEVLPEAAGLEPLGRQQREWQTLSALLGNRIYQAYLVTPGAERPRLAFKTVRREDVKTAGARIDLAQTALVLDASGGYRAQVSFSLDNTSEQFLQIELPAGAELWTVHVAGEPAKPIRADRAAASPEAAGDAGTPEPADARRVLVPVLKTARGDLNHEVVLKYGGRMPALGCCGSVRFPLIHAVRSYPGNETVGIERSQVELFVPQTQSWFNFGGTMHLVGDEGDILAGIVAAKTRQAQRLIETAKQAADPFAKVRALSNLKTLALDMEETQKGQSRLGRQAAANPSLQTELTQNWVSLQAANEQLKQAEQAQQPAAQTEIEDNRERLNDLYNKQDVSRSRNVVAQLGQNTYGGTVVSGGKLSLGTTGKLPPQGQPAMPAPAAQSDFNGQWFERNNLVTHGYSVGDLALPQSELQKSLAGPGNQPQAMTKAGAGTMTLSGGTVTLGGANTYRGGTVTGNGGLSFSAGVVSDAGIVGNVMPNAPEVQGFAKFKQQVEQPAAQQQRVVMNNANMDSLQSDVQQYQQKLQQQAANQSQPMAQQAWGMNYEEGRRQGGQQGQAYVGGIGAGFAGRGSGTRSGVASDAFTVAKPQYQVAAAPGPGPATAPAPTPAPAAVPAPAVQPPMAGATAGLSSSAAAEPAKSDEGGIAAPKPEPPAAVVAAGLASLDFELPRRGTVYRFTTPRGEVELTARHVSNDLLTRLGGLVLVALVGLAACYGVRQARPGQLAWLARPAGIILLLLVGLVMIAGGVLPVLGLVLLAAGTVLAVGRLWARHQAR
ncbi:MAG: autotransporter-associated beta strand repeat-containing protein [Thermoguttaceae bacterium]|jgi:hypothetical protein